MSNKMKTFGIIGAIAAFVYLYKKNAKVKETVDKTVETVKETADKATDKVFEAATTFEEKHPDAYMKVAKGMKYLPVVAAGVAFGIGMNTRRRIRNNAMAQYEKAKEAIYDHWNSGWDEKYRYNYDRVREFAKTLDLFEGESFMIEDQKQFLSDPASYYANMDPTMPVVSHMVWNEGVYPPEDNN